MISIGDLVGLILFGNCEAIDRRAREWKDECRKRADAGVEIAYVRKDFVEACVPREYSADS